jgi:hypothetical protein
MSGASDARPERGPGEPRRQETGMTTTTITMTVDWERIHAAMTMLDIARRDTHIGYDGMCDAFGGSYSGQRYESAGAAGLCSLARAVSSICFGAWDAVHDAAGHIRAASIEDDGARAEAGTMYWSVRCAGRDDMPHVSHRGAAWRATRYGGAIERRINGARLAQILRNRENRARAQSRAAVRVALACHAAFEALAATGIIEYRPHSHICGQHKGLLSIQGLGWIAGKTEDHGWCSIDEARQYARA